MSETTITVPIVSIEDVEGFIAAGSRTIIDVNGAERYAQGHVPGAVHVDKTNLVAELPDDKSAGLVFYCGGPTCQAAPNAARTAASLGYENVAVLSAGISGWTEAGKPVDAA
ncbi:MAG: rhodanese-like domain-containing protein [Microbacterium sp.]